MTREEAIRHLQLCLEPEEHVIMMFWSRESFDHDMTDQEWEKVVSKTDEYEFSGAHQSVDEVVFDIIRNVKGVRQ